MHTSRSAVLLPGWQPAADQRAGLASLARDAGGKDPVWMRSRKKAPMLPPLYRTGSPCIGRLPADHAHPDPVRTASRGPPGRPAGHCRACVTTATTWNATRWPHRPPGSAAAQRPGPYPVMTADQSRWRIPAVARRAVAVLAKPFRPGRTRQGPSMYEMEGPCPASPHRLASCLALLAQRATRRGQVPVRGTGLPAPPTFPGSPPGDARFRTVRTFLLPERAPRKSPRPSHFRFSRYPQRNPRKTGSYPHLTAVIHGLVHSLSTGSLV